MDFQRVSPGLTPLSTQVPIIKLIERETNCMVDISFNVNSGPENTEIVQRYLREHAELRQLVLVLKYFLAQNRLNEPYWGGMGSYALVLLATFIIKRKKASLPAPPTDQLNLGDLLIEFFRFFGKEIKTETEAVSVKNCSVFTKESRGWFDPANPLSYSVEDPQNSGAHHCITLATNASHLTCSLHFCHTHPPHRERCRSWHVLCSGRAPCLQRRPRLPHFADHASDAAKHDHHLRQALRGLPHDNGPPLHLQLRRAHQAA